MFSLICAWTNGWVSNRYAGDFRHHCAHYNVTVMTSVLRATNNSNITMVTRDPSGKLDTRAHPSNNRRETLTQNYLGITRRWATHCDYKSYRKWGCDCTENVQDIYHWYEFENQCKISATLPSLKCENDRVWEALTRLKIAALTMTNMKNIVQKTQIPGVPGYYQTNALLSHGTLLLAWINFNHINHSMDN